jgi:hypothetical protein
VGSLDEATGMVTNETEGPPGLQESTESGWRIFSRWLSN